MNIKFWGVRGSIPCPGPTTARYGGNTACVELYIASLDRRIIIDAGSGIRELGNWLLGEGKRPNGLMSEIFLTHTHWDHIMGFPFFAPIYLPSSQITIYGPTTYEEESLKSVLNGQWSYRYFPVRHEELSSKLSYVDLKEGQYDLGQGIQLHTKYLNHPLLCLGYRFEFNGKVMCTAFDTEPYSNVFCTDPSNPQYDETLALEGARAAAEENLRMEHFIRGADLLIYDAQYTQSEYLQSRIGWGHSPIEHVIDMARRNQVKQLVLFHHDVLRTDAQLDALQADHCWSENGHGLRSFFAREGMSIEI
jgi:phosphoribosyl 1,2-cyclic phosphodiesterase